MNKFFFVLIISINSIYAQEIEKKQLAITSGMGIDYSYVPMVVDYINNNYANGKVLSEVNTAVEFWGSMNYPISDKFDVELDYAYNYFSYSDFLFMGSYYELSKTSNIISGLILYKIPISNVIFRFGLGGNANFVTLEEKVLQKNSGSAIGFGLSGKTEMLVPFSENTFASLSTVVRYALIGTANSDNYIFYDEVTAKEVELNYLSAIFRIGLHYKF